MKKLFTRTVCILLLFLFSISLFSCQDSVIKPENRNLECNDDFELPSSQVSHEDEKYSYSYYEKDNTNHAEILNLALNI